jgi:CDP-glucose 4,6-dehydratase
MNCLITGHTGFLGSAIVGGVKKENKEDLVVGIERDDNKRRDLRYKPDVFVKGDIRDYDFIRRVIVDYEIEEIYHCAAQAIVRSCANDPYTTYDINVMGTVAMLEACRNSGDTVKSVVVSTSDKAFGHAEIPYTEETPLNPLYTYETSKACQQLISLSFYHNYGIPVKVVASSNVYGPGDPNLSRIIPNTIVRLARGEQALLNEGASRHVREFVYIDDVVNAFITVARKGKSGEVYCCGGTQHLSIDKLLEKICVMMGFDPALEIKLFQKAKYFKEIEQQYIDSSKLRELGWKPTVRLEEGLKRSIEYYQGLVERERK